MKKSQGGRTEEPDRCDITSHVKTHTANRGDVTGDLSQNTTHSFIECLDDMEGESS